MDKKISQLRELVEAAEPQAATSRPASEWPHERTLILWLAFATIWTLSLLAAGGAWKAAFAAPDIWHGIARFTDPIDHDMLLEAAIFGIVTGGVLAALLAGLARERARRMLR